MMETKKQGGKDSMKCVLVALLILAILAGVMQCSATVITPPVNVQLDGGNESNGAWTGGYLSFTEAVDQADLFEWKMLLPANTTGKQDAETRIYTNMSVEISIKPQQASYRRELMESEISNRYVTPIVYKGGIDYKWFGIGVGGIDKSVSIDPLICDHYTWAERAWTRSTNSTIEIRINGTLIGNATMNTDAGTKTLIVPTPYGDAMFKCVGTLAPDVQDPQVPTDPVIFSEDYIYSDEALQYIRYDHGKTHTQDENSIVYRISDTEAFSAYWFGDVRWKVGDTEMDTPAPYKYLGGGILGGFAEIDVRKGWKDASVPLNVIREPIRPVIFPENGSDSLISYLNRKCSMGNIATTWLEGYDWNLEYSDGKPSAVVVKLPWGAYSGTPIINCLLPSSLADTVVWHAPLSKMEIVDSHWVNGSECNASKTLWGQLTLQQFATIESSALITAELSTDKAEIDGFPQTVTLQCNETKVIDFYLTNKGVENDTEAVINFTVRRSFDEVITNSTTLRFVLRAPRIPTISDANDRPEQSGKPAQPVLESGFQPWFWLAIAGLCTFAICFLGSLVYKSKTAQGVLKKGTLELGKQAKGIGKEGLGIGKSLWKSSATFRRLCGFIIGISMIAVAFYGYNFFATVHLSIIAVPGAVLVGGFGATLSIVCVIKTFC